MKDEDAENSGLSAQALPGLSDFLQSVRQSLSERDQLVQRLGAMDERIRAQEAELELLRSKAEKYEASITSLTDTNERFSRQIDDTKKFRNYLTLVGILETVNATERRARETVTTMAPRAAGFVAAGLSALAFSIGMHPDRPLTENPTAILMFNAVWFMAVAGIFMTRAYFNNSKIARQAHRQAESLRQRVLELHDSLSPHFDEFDLNIESIRLEALFGEEEAGATFNRQVRRANQAQIEPTLPSA